MQASQLIAGRYELQRQLGEGGTATVWLARDLTLERPVAIKFLEMGGARDRERMTEQFLREARIAASVRHRNVIQILDFGVHEGAPFMAMEALSGETMADRFDRAEAFSLREVVEIAARCLEGLAAVHDAGIVHRDLKPENVFLVREPTGVHPKLLDFGISRAVDKRDGRRSAIPTEAGRVIGTPEYMSPEQARGHTDLDLRTDLYALGVVMYEALTGRLPYDAPHMGEVLIKVVAGGAPDVAQIAPSVGWPISDVVAKAMQRKREDRFASAMEMRAALLAAAQPLLADGTDPIALPAVPNRGQRGLHSRLPTNEESLGQDAQRAAATLTESQARPPRASSLVIVASTAAAAVLVAAGSFAFIARAPAHSPSEPRYIIVQGGKNEPPPNVATAEPQVAGATISDPSMQAAMDQVQDQVQAEATREPAAEHRRPRAELQREPERRSPAQALARAFDRQKSQVVQCLNRHADQFAERMQMSVRLTLDTAGHVHSVELMPQPIAATPAGACIASAVRAMRFGPQAAAISFRVPLTAKRAQSQQTAR